ncbi:MAG: hypothetical protein FJ225_05235 [Lentisphaerae bacterium]|nr:hypothetical protein [Lentisphaerota bacterium]
MLKRKSILDRRLKRIAREIDALDSTIETLARSAGKAPPAGAPPAAPSASPAPRRAPGTARRRRTPAADEDRALRAVSERAGEAARNDRFVSYLMAHGLDATRPFRHERRIQRNKAIVVSLAALAVLLWVLFRLVA